LKFIWKLDFDIWDLANGIATPSARHPHLNPLPSRERKFGSQMKKEELCPTKNGL